MVNRIARNKFDKVVGDSNLRKAVALAILLKDHNRTSVYKDFSYRELARVSNLSPNTCKKRIQILIQNNLAHISQEKGHNYLHLHKLRRGLVKYESTRPNGEKITKLWQPHNADVKLDNINRNSVWDIEQGLMALVIVEKTKRKEFVKHTIELAHNPSRYEKLKKIKRAKKLCNKYGYGDTFVDNGLCYATLRKILKCSPNSVKRVIEYGETNKLFNVERRSWQLIAFCGLNCAKFALPFFLQQENRPLFATKSNIWYKPALSFSLPCQAL